jgi:hypothetical protein
MPSEFLFQTHICVYLPTRLLISFPFPSRFIFLIAISLFIADWRSGNSSTYTNFTGQRVRV